MTTLVRWDPAVEVDSLQSEVNRLFDSFFSGSGSGRGNGGGVRRWVPPIDLAETEEELVLTADLPGLDEDDVAIEIKDRVLTISGERRDRREEQGKGWHRIERSAGRFARSLALPEGVDAERVGAHFDRGVLEVRIPKPEARKPHRVEITGGAVEADATEKA
jgi:HSP20 family protein